MEILNYLMDHILYEIFKIILSDHFQQNSKDLNTFVPNKLFG